MSGIDHYKSAGVKFSLQKRHKNIALFAAVDEKHFEVVRIRKLLKDKTYPDGQTVPAGHETMPPTSAWGKHGFSYLSREKAEDRFYQMAGSGSAEGLVH